MNKGSAVPREQSGLGPPTEAVQDVVEYPFYYSLEEMETTGQELACLTIAREVQQAEEPGSDTAELDCRIIAARSVYLRIHQRYQDGL